MSLNIADFRETPPDGVHAASINFGKRIELLKDAVPGTSRIGVIVNPDDATDAGALKSLPAAARALNLDHLRILEVRSLAQLEAAFATAVREDMHGLYISQTPMFFTHRTEVAAMAMRARLPAVDGFRELHVWFFSVPSEDLHQSTGRGGVRQIVVLGSTAPGTSGTPGIGVFLHGGATVCVVGVLLMSGKLTCCIASR